MFRKKGWRPHKHDHCFDDCCPVDVEAIADPVAQAASDDGKNTGGNLFDEIKNSEIELDLIVTERGRGDQKVVE